MKATRIIAAAALVIGSAFALPVGQAQQVGARRIDLQRHDLSVTGREVIQTIVELAPGTTAPRHTHPGEEIIYVLEGTWEYTVEGKPPVTSRWATSCSSRPAPSTRPGTSAPPREWSSPRTSSKKGNRSSPWSSERPERVDV